MVTFKKVVWDLLLWALRGVFPAFALGFWWWKTRGQGDVPMLKTIAALLGTFVVMLYADVQELKARVRELEGPAETTRWVKDRVRQSRRAAK